MNKKVGDLFRIGTTALLVLAAVMISGALSMLHQGEDHYLFGKVVVWCGRIALVSCLIGALMIFVYSQKALIAIWIALLFAIPISVVTSAPIVWCVFLKCSDASWGFANLEWGGVMLLLPQIIALFYIHHSARQ